MEKNKVKVLSYTSVICPSLLIQHTVFALEPVAFIYASYAALTYGCALPIPPLDHVETTSSDPRLHITSPA